MPQTPDGERGAWFWRGESAQAIKGRRGARRMERACILGDREWRFGSCKGFGV